MEEKKTYGKAVIAAETSERREVDVIDFVQASYTGNRVITVSSLDNDEGYILSVENVASSGRNPNSQMFLSKESFIGLMSTSILYWGCKGIDMADLIKEATQGKSINYNFSDNLKSIEDE